MVLRLYQIKMITPWVFEWSCWDKNLVPPSWNFDRTTKAELLYVVSYLQVTLIMFDISIEEKGTITCSSDEKLAFLLVEEQRRPCNRWKTFKCNILTMNNICLFAQFLILHINKTLKDGKRKLNQKTDLRRYSNAFSPASSKLGKSSEVWNARNQHF